MGNVIKDNIKDWKKNIDRKRQVALKYNHVMSLFLNTFEIMEMNW